MTAHRPTITMAPITMTISSTTTSSATSPATTTTTTTTIHHRCPIRSRSSSTPSRSPRRGKEAR